MDRNAHCKVGIERKEVGPMGSVAPTSREAQMASLKEGSELASEWSPGQLQTGRLPQAAHPEKNHSFSHRCGQECHTHCPLDRPGTRRGSVSCLFPISRSWRENEEENASQRPQTILRLGLPASEGRAINAYSIDCALKLPVMGRLIYSYYL